MDGRVERPDGLRRPGRGCAITDAVSLSLHWCLLRVASLEVPTAITSYRSRM